MKLDLYCVWEREQILFHCLPPLQMRWYIVSEPYSLGRNITMWKHYAISVVVEKPPCSNSWASSFWAAKNERTLRNVKFFYIIAISNQSDSSGFLDRCRSQSDRQCWDYKNVCGCWKTSVDHQSFLRRKCVRE